LPCNVAELLVTSDGEDVVAVGGRFDVVNVASEPAVDPDAFVETTLKWYVVPDTRPVNVACADVEVVPEPPSVVAVWKP
jgi:hypothetical protein